MDNCLHVTKQNDSVKTPKKSIKDYFQPRENENNSQLNKLKIKTTQVNLDACIPVGDLIQDISTAHYWKVLAEKRRIALQEVLTENKLLWNLRESLKSEIAENQKLLNEANSFIEVIKELTQDEVNDTGVDVNDSISS